MVAMSMPLIHYDMICLGSWLSRALVHVCGQANQFIPSEMPIKHVQHDLACHDKNIQQTATSQLARPQSTDHPHLVPIKHLIKALTPFDFAAHTLL
jgi:hypothetical protein